ncbi:MAG: rRNA pseudouridine synthase [Acidobacteriaceae bacterium]|nr:rRNA pseudouridine synthase [Acidobacteriaceae bacterium]
MSEPVRLQKIIAQAGLASRRAAEELILTGRVTLNGEIVTELGTKADPERDHIRVDGKLLHGPERHRYFVLNKPRGYVTTLSDPEGRPTIMELFAKSPKAPRERLYPVGRLDYLSEGLLILTNDGELANALSKASSGVAKTYLVKISGQPSEQALHQLRGGIMIERGRLQEGDRRNRVLTQPAEIALPRGGENPWYSVTLTEGRNRQLRKMFEEIGHHVEKIRRIAYGGLVLDVEPGEFRELTPGEVTALGRASQGRKVERKKVLPEAAKLKEPAKPKRKPGAKSSFKPAGPRRRSR